MLLPVVTYHLISLVLFVQSRNVVELVVWYRIELVLAGCVVSILQVLSVCLSVVYIVLFLCEVSVECLRSYTPTAQVKVASVLHSKFQSTFPAQTLACCSLVLEVRLWIESYLTLVFCISDVLAYRVLCTLTDVVDDSAGL